MLTSRLTSVLFLVCCPQDLGEPQVCLLHYQERDQLVALSSTGNLLLLGRNDTGSSQVGDSGADPWVVLLRMKFASGPGMQVTWAATGCWCNWCKKGLHRGPRHDRDVPFGCSEMSSDECLCKEPCRSSLTERSQLLDYAGVHQILVTQNMQTRLHCPSKAANGHCTAMHSGTYELLLKPSCPGRPAASFLVVFRQSGLGHTLWLQQTSGSLLYACLTLMLRPTIAWRWTHRSSPSRAKLYTARTNQVQGDALSCMRDKQSPAS